LQRLERDKKWAGISNSADPTLAALMKSAELAKAEQAQAVQAAAVPPVADVSGRPVPASGSRFAAAAAMAAVPGPAVPVHRLGQHQPVADPTLAALMKSAELAKAEQVQTVQAAAVPPVADVSGRPGPASSSRFAAGTPSPAPALTGKSPARTFDDDSRKRSASSGSISI
jgi:hypothetical protein